MKNKKYFFIFLFFSLNLSVAKATTGNLRNKTDELHLASWGLQSSFIENTVTAEETDYLGENIERVVMRGSGIGLYGFYNQFVSERWVLHSDFGYEPLNAVGIASIMGCDTQSSNRCNVNIDYLIGAVAIRSIFPQTNFDIWLSLGVSIKQPFKISSTALVSSKISTTNNLNFGFGVDYNFDKNNFMPISLQYSLFPKVSGVTASSLIFKFGYGWRL